MSKSLAAIFYERAKSLTSHPAVRFREGKKPYQDMSWTDYSALCEEMAFGLAALGLEPGGKAAIFSGNSHLWVAADLATISNGGTSVPVYPTCSQSDIEFILSNSESQFVFVQNERMLKRVAEAREKAGNVQHIVLLSNLDNGKTPTELAQALGLTGEHAIITVDQLRQIGAQFARQKPNLIDERVQATSIQDLATIIYTSGTTGTPKGAGLTHSIILSVLNDLRYVLPISTEDVYMSYLPLSHVFERVCGEFYWMYNGGTCAFAESIETMAKNLGEVQPSMILVVPRVLDRIYAKVKSGIEGAPERRRKLIDWAIYVGKEVVRAKASGQTQGLKLQLSHAVAEKLVFTKLREKIGAKLRLVVSGGAPATPHVIEFFNAVGIKTLEGYGLTETAAPATVNRMHKVKIGSVGPALPSVEMKIAEDGEVLLRGPSICTSYYKNEAANKDAFTEDGWFKTGDIGTIDGDGYLRITDRKKDLIVNSAGKNIAPQRIEAVLKTIPFVTQAVVFGDKQKYLSALITLDEVPVTEFAREKGWSFSTYMDLARSPKLNEFVRKEIQLRSGQLADYEQVKRFAILPQELSVEEGELTATLKIKRNVVAKKYRALVEALYKEESAVEAVLNSSFSTAPFAGTPR